MLQRAFGKAKTNGGVAGGNNCFPPEVLQMICTFAGIGTISVADKKTPWIPTMLPRQIGAPTATWNNAYSIVDRHICRLKTRRLELAEPLQK